MRTALTALVGALFGLDATARAQASRKLTRPEGRGSFLKEA